MAVPPVGATVAVDMASSCAPRCRALEDVLMHGQDCVGTRGETEDKTMDTAEELGLLLYVQDDSNESVQTM